MQTIIPLPLPIQRAITSVLNEQGADAWLKRAQALHQRYTQQAEDKQQTHLTDYGDAVAYLALRASATYAQIYGAVAAVCELMPDWQPETLLDLGSGPGPGVWAVSSLLPTLTQATCIDQNTHFLTIGPKISTAAELPITVTWQRGDIVQRVEQMTTSVDLLLIANVLNELNADQRAKLLNAAFARCRGILIVVEPGTPVGSRIVQMAAQQLAPNGILIAPYLANQVVQEEWLHFPQRFTRPDFARRLRQAMRDSPLMASDWEEAKYSYVAIGKVEPEIRPWGRTVGPVQLMSGYLELPVLTGEQCRTIKVLKRHKPQYTFAKKLRWGETIGQRTNLIPAADIVGR